MKVATFEATVENGQIKLLQDSVRLPEHATVYVVVPGVEEKPLIHMPSPRLARREDAAYFVKEIVEEPSDAGV